MISKTCLVVVSCWVLFQLFVLVDPRRRWKKVQYCFFFLSSVVSLFALCGAIWEVLPGMRSEYAVGFFANFSMVAILSPLLAAALILIGPGLLYEEPHPKMETMAKHALVFGILLLFPAMAIIMPICFFDAWNLPGELISMYSGNALPLGTVIIMFMAVSVALAAMSLRARGITVMGERCHCFVCGLGVIEDEHLRCGPPTFENFGAGDPRVTFRDIAGSLTRRGC